MKAAFIVIHSATMTAMHVATIPVMNTRWQSPMSGPERASLGSILPHYFPNNPSTAAISTNTVVWPMKP